MGGEGRKGGRAEDIQKRSSDGVWHSAKGLLRAGKVDGINHGAGACAMRVHLEKEELGGLGEGGVRGQSLLIQWFPWEIEKLGHFPCVPDGAAPICLSASLFLHILLTLALERWSSSPPPLSVWCTLIHFPEPHTISITSTDTAWATFFYSILLVKLQSSNGK